MKQIRRLGILILMLTASMLASAINLSVDLTNGNLLTADEIADKPMVSIGVDADGNRVEDGGEAVATLSGKYHSNEHGWTNFSATVAVEGPVKITFGTCAWGGDVTVKIGNETVATFNTNTGACYHNNKAENVVSGYYKGSEAATLTISGGSYVPYFAVEDVDPSTLIEEATVSFSTGTEQPQGTFPADIKAEVGTNIAIPLNRTLYLEGYTLTAWTDGAQNYAPGAAFTVPAEGATLTPVFTQNSVNFEDRTEAVTATWDFQRKNDAPLLNYQGNGAVGIYVTQVTVNGAVIDLKLDFDATDGKIANGSWTEWCQMNSGTVLTLPACTGTEVSFYSMNEPTGTTVAGSSDWTFASSVTSYTYEGVASSLSIVIGGGSYYRWVKAVYPVPTGGQDLPTSSTISFSLGDETAEGTLPEGGTIDYGTPFAIPVNHTLYKEGYTLTGWTDGVNTYAPGTSFDAMEETIALTPVFTQNSANLSDRTEAVTVVFDFQRQNGAPLMAYEGPSGIFVTQATVNGESIDVKLDFNTAGGGKIANGNWIDWCQMNGGTVLTVPSCKGATVSINSFSATTTTTIDGQTDYETNGTTVTYTVASPAETIDIVIGDGSYFSTFTIVLPVVQQSGGTTYTNEVATVVWPFSDENNISDYTASPEGVFSTVSVDLGENITTAGTGTSLESPGITFVKLAPTTKTDAVEWSVKPVAGLTFTPTKVSANITRFGTDQEHAVIVTAKAGDGETITLGTYTAARANKTQAEDKYGSNDDYATRFDIELTSEQQATLTSADGFSLFVTVGVPSGKQGGFAEVVIEGLVNGSVQDVNKYTFAAVADPEEGGTVNVYPVAEEYEEGSELTLTATENFGYDFVSWTDEEGNTVSEEAKFKYTVNGDAVLTANFVQVETYELTLNVEGGANDYMVLLDPLPTDVDGKMMYEAGTVVTITATGNKILTFTGWDDGQTTSERQVTMNSDVALTATFEATDFIAGWDFYKKGNSGRVADFASADNESAAFSLVNTATGETSSWLDKSTEAAGGYESLKGAAVNWKTGTENGDVGNWHWQTKVNAEAFTNVVVSFDMLYNYNSYTVYDVEFSTDGDTWTKAGSINLDGPKKVNSAEIALGEDADNQAELYIRWIANKTSEIKGSASANDGNTIANIYILGSAEILNDGQAPQLVKTVPENNATGASATGKIVLTFDERVKVAEGTTATLGDKTLTPSVMGKAVTFEYRQLDYDTDYTFTLPGGSISDLTDNTLEEAITINFHTMMREAVGKTLYDAVVSNVEELVEAIKAANNRADKTTRYRIFVKSGEYNIPLSETMKTVNGFDVPECITFITASNISFIGEDRDATVITNAIPADATFAGTYGTTSKYDGIGNSDVLQIAGNVTDTYFQDITIKSGIEDARGRNIAVQDRGTRTIYKNAKLYGYQDTWTSNKNDGLYYFEGGVVRGRTDYLCGKGDAFFNEVTLQQLAGGYLAVPSTPANIGWVFLDCTINGDGSGVDGNYTLGRPWGSGTPVALFINTTMNVLPSAIGWNEMSNGWPKRFAEYNSMTATGSTVDLSGRKKTFGDGHANNPVLTMEEADTYSDMSLMFGEWTPAAMTEQVPVITDVTLSGTTLSWTGSDYALLYAIVKDGQVIDFTLDTEYIVDDASAEYTIRAANERGGLNEPSAVAVEAPTVPTAITQVATESIDSPAYNMAGQRVNSSFKGIVIKKGQKVVNK